MNAKKIMGAVLVALLAAALFVGAGAATDPTDVGTVYAYTNLSFTEKMKEDPFKLYDILVSTGIFTDIIDCICKKDWAEIQADVWDTIKNIYDYKNSAMGILEMVSSDYNDLNLDAQNIQKALGDPENLSLLKNVMTKLG